MDQTYWLRQTDKPLFPELEWSRPETKTQAGKLLIIGGNTHGFAAPAEAYGEVMKAGAGTIRVLLPESLRRSVSKLFPEAEFAPSTPSGSFAANALAELLDASLWSDAVLLPGDVSRNSETTVLLENFLEKYPGQVTLTKDAADLFAQQPLSVLHRPNTLLVVAMGQLRRLGSEAHYPRAFTSEIGLVQLVDNLYEFTKRFSLSIITRHQNHYVVASNGQVSTTAITGEQPVWRLKTAAHASIWWLQNSSKPFEALTVAAHEIAVKS
jgi:NAD(P)H-hydrate repair Nnr-like enzyme with NAD(P)H-hydrate dehydratase domain